jgi:hypothetical protein
MAEPGRPVSCDIDDIARKMVSMSEWSRRAREVQMAGDDRPAPPDSSYKTVPMTDDDQMFRRKCAEELQVISAHSTGSIAASTNAQSTNSLLVRVQHLKEAGLTLDEISRHVYEHLHDQSLPNFMEQLDLDEDGGLDRVHTLWYTERIFWAVILFVFVIMNVVYLISGNWTVFDSFVTHILKKDRLSVRNGSPSVLPTCQSVRPMRPTVRPSVRSVRPLLCPSAHPSLRPSVRPTDRPTDRPSAWVLGPWGPQDP